MLLVGGLGYRLGYEADQRQSAAYSYAERSQNRALSQCDEVETSRLAPCIAEKKKAAEEAESTAREEQDLTAQQQAAWAGMLSSLWALLTLFTAALGLFWIKRTFDATRDAVEIARNSQILEYRPIMAFDKAEIKPWSGNNLKIIPVWKNVGKLPAQLIRTTASIEYYDTESITKDDIFTLLMDKPGWQDKRSILVAANATHEGQVVAVLGDRCEAPEHKGGLGSLMSPEGMYFAEKTCVIAFRVEYSAALDQMGEQKWFSERVQAYRMIFNGMGKIQDSFAWISSVDGYPDDLMT